MNIKIQKTTANDAKIIALLARVTFRESFGHFFSEKDLQDYFLQSFTVQKVEADLKDENNVFWLAFADDLPVGYAKLKKCSPSEILVAENLAELEKIYVLQDLIGNGIGKKLQNELFAEAKKFEASHLWLTVRHDNEKAIHFYEKHGFGEVGKQSYLVGEQTVKCKVMMKEL